MRTDIQIPVAGDRLAAWLYRPAASTAPAACLIMAHGFTGVRDMQLGGAAERFAQAGFAVLVFDYRNFGDSDGQPRQVLDLPKQYQDWDAAIEQARHIDGIDPRRLVLWGTSFSGGHVIDAATRHSDIAAVIAQAPFVDGLAVALTMPPLLAIRLTLDAWRDQLGAWRGKPPRLVPVACPPHGFAVLSAPHVWNAIPVVVPPDSTWRNEVAARIVLRLPTHRPVRHAQRVTCPLLVQVLDDETVLPTRPPARAAEKAPLGQVRHYRGLDHFDVYVGNGFEQLHAHQVAFLRQVLPAQETPPTTHTGS